MKKHFLTFALAAVLTASTMTGCRVRAAVHDVQPVEQAAVSTTGAATQPRPAPAPALTAEEAQEIALKHAGFTAGQVSRLRTEYDFDHGIARYDVEFHQGGREYNYEIHAGTGEILSFEMDQ